MRARCIKDVHLDQKRRELAAPVVESASPNASVGAGSRPGESAEAPRPPPRELTTCSVTIDITVIPLVLRDRPSA
jgi:hypothetical protein